MIKKHRKNKKNGDFIEIFGIHAVKAALNNKDRNHKELIISEKLKHYFQDFIKNVDKKSVIPNIEFNKIYGSEKNHQGVILITTNIKQKNLEDILFNRKKNQIDLVIMLDQITDPQNIGSIIRSCSLFNCHSVIVSKKNSPDVTSSIIKAASGALETINYIKVINLHREIEKFKKHNYWVVGFDNNTNDSLTHNQLPKKCLLIFGAENKGMRQLTKKACDQILKIPIKKNIKFKIDSLNVSNACAIAMYEHFKLYN